jgi:hypothetical protein
MKLKFFALFKGESTPMHIKEGRFEFAAVAIAAGLVMLLGATPAHATLLLQSGVVGGSGDVDNVVFNPCSAEIVGPATTVQGCLNSSHTTLVNFTSNENLVADGGQATIDAQDGSFDTITIKLDDTSLGFLKLQFNLDAVADGFANFEAKDQLGNTFTFNNLALDGDGENFFTLFSLDNQVAVSFKLVSTVGLQLIGDLDQVRLGPTNVCTEDCTSTTATQATSIPEPSTLFLLGSGLLVLARATGWKRN